MGKFERESNPFMKSRETYAQYIHRCNLSMKEIKSSAKKMVGENTVTKHQTFLMQERKKVSRRCII
jgi:hypothetical protein